MATEALVSPELLRWARERASMPVDTFAEKLAVAAHTVTAWETGDAHPTFRQAEKVAAVAHVPFGYLFLAEPPKEEALLPDLRGGSAAVRGRFSADFLDLLRDALFKHAWFREHLLDQGAERRDFVGRFSIRTAVERVAADIRAVLRIDPAVTSGRTWEQYLSDLFDRCEASGIWVMRTGIVGSNTHRTLSVDEFRGFAIADDIVPLVFINGRDARAAQAFTLAHELAHIWLGSTGISNPSLAQRADAVMERRCDAIAAETLVPRHAFLSQWDDRRSLEENAQLLSRYFHVSRAVAARQAVEAGKLGWHDFLTFLIQERVSWNVKSESSGGDYYATTPVRNGKRFTRAVLSSAMGGSLLLRDAGQLLGMKPATMRKLYEKQTSVA